MAVCGARRLPREAALPCALSDMLCAPGPSLADPALYLGVPADTPLPSLSASSNSLY